MARKAEVIITCDATTVKQIMAGLNREMEKTKQRRQELQAQQRTSVGLTKAEEKELQGLIKYENALNDKQQKLTGETKKLNQVMQDLAGSKLKDLKRALSEGKRALDNMAGNDPNRRRLVNDLKMIQKQIETNTGAIKKNASAWGSLGTTLKNLVAYAGVFSMFNRLKSLFTDMMKKNFEFSDQLANIRKVSGLAMRDINNLATRLAKIDTRSTIQELNELAYTGSKLGFGEYGVEGLESFVKSALKVQNALKEDMGADAMTSLSKMVEVMGLIPKMGVERAMDAAGSAIFKLASTSTATGSNIVEFSKRLMGLANIAGISTDELLAFGSAADSMALMPEVAATAFNKLITAMQKQPNLIENALKIPAGTINELYQAGRMSDAIVTVFEKMRETGGMNALMHAGVFKDLGSDGARLVGVMATMADRVDILNKHMATSREAFKEATAVEQEYNIQMETAEAYMERASNLWQKAFINPEGVDNVKSFAQAWYDVSKAITQDKLVMFQLQLAINSILVAIKALIAILPGLIYGLGVRGLVWTFQAVWSALTGATEATNKFRTAWAGMSTAMKANWISLAIGLLLQLSIYLVSTSDKLKELLGIETEAEKKMNDMCKAHAEAHAAADKAAEGLEKYKKALENANMSQAERTSLISKFKSEFGVYLNYLNKEIKTVDDLRDAYADVVRVMRQKKLYEEKENYKQSLTGERKTQNRQTGVQIDDALLELGIDTKKVNFGTIQKISGYDPTYIYRTIMEGAFGANEGDELEHWVTNRKNRRTYKSRNGKKLLDLIKQYTQMDQEIRKDENDVERMFAHDLEGYNNDAFEQSKMIDHTKNYDALEDAPDKGAAAAARKAAADQKQILRKELQDAQQESDAIISKIEEWYRLQETIITGYAADGIWTQEKADQMLAQLNIAKNKALADARRGISGRDEKSWEETKQQIGQLMFDTSDMSKNLLDAIMKVKLENVRTALGKIDSAGIDGISSTAMRDKLNKNAAGNDREVERIMRKASKEVEQMLLQYDFLEQAIRAFDTRLEKLGLLGESAAAASQRIRSRAGSTEEVDAAEAEYNKQRRKAKESAALQFVANGTENMKVNYNDTAELRSWLADFAGYWQTMGRDDNGNYVPQSGFAKWAEVFREDFELWIKDTGKYKQDIQAFYLSLVNAEEVYYKKRKESYNFEKQQQEQYNRATGLTDTEEQQTTALSNRAKQQDAGIGASFWQQQGLGSIKDDPEVQMIQTRIYYRNLDVEYAQKHLEQMQEMQDKEIEMMKLRNATEEELDQKREEHRLARMGLEDLLKERQSQLFEQETTLATKVSQELQKRVQTINSLTKPITDFTQAAGRKIGDMIFNMESEEATWEELWKNMALAVGESVIQMGAQYAQNLLMQQAMNRASEAETVADAGVKVSAGIAAGSAKTIGELGWWGIPLIGIISSVLMGLLQSALSTKSNKDGSSSSSSASSSTIKTKLVSGMLTYDEGNVGTYQGTDGQSYHATQVSAPADGLVTQPIATTVQGQPALVAERGPEIVIGRRTTKAIMMNEPGLIRYLANYGKGASAGPRYRAFDGGNLDDITQQLPDGQTTTGGGGITADDAQKLVAAIGAFNQTVNQMQQKGIPCYINKYGSGGLIDEVKSGMKFDSKYNK